MTQPTTPAQRQTTDGLALSPERLPTHEEIHAALDQLRSFLWFQGFGSDEPSPTFNALRLIIADYERLNNELASIGTTVAGLEFLSPAGGVVTDDTARAAIGKLQRAAASIDQHETLNLEHVADACEEAAILLAKYCDALLSIATNTCCDKCQEAALVAKAALSASPTGAGEQQTYNQVPPAAGYEL